MEIGDRIVVLIEEIGRSQPAAGARYLGANNMTPFSTTSRSWTALDRCCVLHLGPGTFPVMGKAGG